MRARLTAISTVFAVLALTSCGQNGPRPAAHAAPVSVRIGDNDEVYWNGNRLHNDAELRSRLIGTTKRNPDTDFHITVSSKASYAAVSHVLKIAQRAGVHRIGIVETEKYVPDR